MTVIYIVFNFALFAVITYLAWVAVTIRDLALSAENLASAVSRLDSKIQAVNDLLEQEQKLKKDEEESKQLGGEDEADEYNDFDEIGGNDEYNYE